MIDGCTAEVLLQIDSIVTNFSFHPFDEDRTVCIPLSGQAMVGECIRASIADSAQNVLFAATTYYFRLVLSKFLLRFALG